MKPNNKDPRSYVDLFDQLIYYADHLRSCNDTEFDKAMGTVAKIQATAQLLTVKATKVDWLHGDTAQ